MSPDFGSIPLHSWLPNGMALLRNALTDYWHETVLLWLSGGSLDSIDPSAFPVEFLVTGITTKRICIPPR